ILLCGAWVGEAEAQWLYCATRSTCLGATKGWTTCRWDPETGACWNDGARCSASGDSDDSGGSGGNAFWYWDETSYSYQVWPSDSTDTQQQFRAPVETKRTPSPSAEVSRLIADPRELHLVAARAPRLAQALLAMVASSREGRRLTTGQYVVSRQWGGQGELDRAVSEGRPLASVGDDPADIRFAINVVRSLDRLTRRIFVQPEIAEGESQTRELLFADFFAAGSA